MATRIAWLLNLDADLELQDPDGYRAAPSLAERMVALRSQLSELIAPDDVLLDDEPSAALAAGLPIQTFCPTPSALKRIAALGLPVPLAPSLAVLRAVNDRSFCAALGHGLPGSTFVRGLSALEQHLHQPSPTGTHVLKRAFSFAGREQRRVRDGVLDASTRGFCIRSFERGEGLQLEPWVERVLDFSRHGYLTRAAALRIGPVRVQHCDAMGRFLGMSATPPDLAPELDAALEAEVRMTGRALATAGYFGPFGIDGFQYRTPEGGLALNPRCEINARLTMGFPRDLLQAGLLAEAGGEGSVKR